ncbi:MAG: acetyl-CoA carboxylase biotin carboxyl carrier protein [Rhodospirillales bacterium]|nr:acetyl-CoA carboxylase biotin carboxyl carrier protein [Rhodospirillales bacterium]
MPSLRFEDIAELLRVIDASSCEELVLDTAELKLVVRRHGAPVGGAGITASEPAPVARPRPAAILAPAATRPPDTASSAGKSLSAGLLVNAPMVGTFYRASSPGAPPFVEVGTRVAEGDKLCLIEVMKLYNTIFSPVAGRVLEICAADGELVEYGQTLLILEPE